MWQSATKSEKKEEEEEVEETDIIYRHCTSSSWFCFEDQWGEFAFGSGILSFAGFAFKLNKYSVQ